MKKLREVSLLDGKGNGFRTWLEINRGAVKKNYEIFRALIPKKTKLMAVVKSNAYGHGLIDFSKEMEKRGADFLGVDSVVEALALRREGINTPILVLGFTLPSRISEAAAKNISLSISNFESLAYVLKNAGNFSTPLNIHLKVDTGMHRQGFLSSEQKALISKLKGQKSKLKIGGLFTHFAAAKNPAFPADTNRQIAEFEKWRSAFRKAGFNPIAHAAATSGTLLFPNAHFDMVRIGIGLYGLWPDESVEAYLQDRIKLAPILAWKTVVSEIKKLPKGARIGYEFTEILRRDSVVATCPIGYWHGLSRALSSVGNVLVRGVRAKILGRVSMDMISIDLTDVRGARVGDEAVIIGKSGRNAIMAGEIAALSGTSHYEIITRINPLIKRIYR